MKIKSVTVMAKELINSGLACTGVLMARRNTGIFLEFEFPGKIIEVKVPGNLYVEIENDQPPIEIILDAVPKAMKLWASHIINPSE